jgi:hypothetical protein
MDTIPLELIRAIVEGIDDLQSLKMCSLVGTIFREDCQRILLNSLRLGGDETDEGSSGIAASSFLRESPHVAVYFKKMTFILPAPDAPSAEVQAVREVLDRLSNVRQCYIAGGTIDSHLWQNIPVKLSLAIVEFIRRQRLSELHMYLFGALPTTVFAHMLGAAPTLSFVDVSVDDTDLIADELPRSVVRNILLLSSPGVAKALVSPQFMSRLANVRKLWLEPDLDCSDRLIALVANNLEFIRLEFTGTLSSDPLPHTNRFS